MCGAPVRDKTHITPIFIYVTASLATISIIARCIARTDSFGADDVSALAAWVTGVAMAIIIVIMSAEGFGKDIWTLSPAKITRLLQVSTSSWRSFSTNNFQLVWWCEVAYIASITLTKCSFLFFCLRIFPRKKLRLAVYIALAITVASGLAFILVDVFSCAPVSYAWKGWDGQHKGKCINVRIFVWIFACFNVLLDVGVVALPVPEILRLSLRWKQKIPIIFMFTVGAS
jgi:hypothetical protein